ncbi:hypothetical protein O6H91_03G124500 [Diphasiastrum complanatum]|uniref:Uncharacterized protein n=2 Tax=Diphasiastrum complanatum TaxID=34168 RepID=A0ACC2EB86_DIPCM|nr:hypothetical protein O6H91_14G020900 [Diphasiastrum complanatum]KAJ7563748.1 hypothetical protein O6H91_03G124500 [Diphasiastrum complanatum]
MSSSQGADFIGADTINSQSPSFTAMAPPLSCFSKSTSELRVPQEQISFVKTPANYSPRVLPLGGSLSSWEVSGLKSNTPNLALPDSLRRSPGRGQCSQSSVQSSSNSSGISSQHLFSSSDSLASAITMGGEWQQMLLSTVGCTSGMTSILSSSSKSATNSLNAIADVYANKPSLKVREPKVSFQGILLGKETSFLRPLPPLLSSPSQHQVGGLLSVDKAQSVGSGWNSLETSSNSGITIDPSRGAFASQGISPVSVHDLQQLACDSVFGEAMSIPPFCDGGTSHLATQAFSLKEEDKSMLRFEGALPDIQHPGSSKLLGSSGCSTLESSVPSTLAMGEPVSRPLPELCAVNFRAKASGECLGKRVGEAKGIDVADKSVRKPGSSASLELNRAGFLYTVNYESDETDHPSPRIEDSSGSEQANVGNGSSAAKKRSFLEAKLKDVSCVTTTLNAEDKKEVMNEFALKRQKGVEPAKEEENKSVMERSASDNSGNSTPGSVKENSKPPEPPKADYIHVRARRGQATDSHSLAERVRREKISERMKFLQDLVPGCNKVTGKAVMLDEIINYVQSLQRQVEFLSMKLAAVNSRLDFNLDSRVNKEFMQGSVSQNLAEEIQPASSYPQVYQQKQTQLQAGLKGVLDLRSLSEVPIAPSQGIPISSPSAEGYGGVISQKKSLWDGELQSIVQMGFVQTRQYPLELQELQGQIQAGQLKADI